MKYSTLFTPLLHCILIYYTCDVNICVEMDPGTHMLCARFYPWNRVWQPAVGASPVWRLGAAPAAPTRARGATPERRRGSRAWAASARAARGHAARAPASDGRAHAALSWSDPRQGLRPTPPRAAPSWPWAAAARKKRLTVRVPTPTVCSYGLTCMGLLGHLGLARHIGHMFYHSNFYFL
jgi:hypothetical protein